MRIGLCEDDPAIRRVVSSALRLGGHETTVAHDGREALALFAAHPHPDVVVLDIGLPDADGRDICQALRAAGVHAPVLFLTALGQVHEKIAGFAAGGDDYLPKPFDVKELVVRVEALARRAGRTTAPAATHGLRLDPARHALVFDGAEVGLTPTEYRMLGAIAARPGEVARRRDVVAAGWPDGAIVADNTVDAYAARIRRKLKKVGAPVQLEAVRGVGFTLR
ncbi:response regulator transcription factor [Nocardioides jiangxiensis]|uniref:Response regulator transcription factor n=1 Tax=Nocardioides jiangxiensis TaxID=3064524 RepID=A0ABT9B651_9ACTN|nr:response regulator transcription factor [Nocardioides sp. WY-20]MDO7868786.1 response regulator transcription factor [Nocardioides sp. WY-20]